MIKKILFAATCFYFVVLANAQNIPKLKMADVVKNFDKQNDSIYIINFWATFCKPCVGEIPGFIKIANKYKNKKVKLLLVSVDLPSFYPKKIATFAAKNNFTTNIAWLNETDADYFCPMIDKDWSGAIPATIIVNNKTGYKKFFEGELDGVEFEKELKTAIEDTKAAFNHPNFSMPMNNVVAVNCFDNTHESSAVTFKSRDSTVFSVGEGVVSNVIHLKDENMKVVMISKGDLLYTYSNLKSVVLKRGDKVLTNQMIGYAALDIDEVIPTLDFYFNNGSKFIYLTRHNFVFANRNDTKDHSFDAPAMEAQ
jgi:thiol-disulfide isomerase/thioredoxin